MSEWGKVPPTEAGWYWWRLIDSDEPQVVLVNNTLVTANYSDKLWDIKQFGGQWYPTPIPQPSN